MELKLVQVRQTTIQRNKDLSWKGSIRIRAAKHAPEILVADQQSSTASAMGRLCKQLGYKPRGDLVKGPTGDWYQWWYLPKKRQTRAEVEQQIDEELHTGNNKWSARREGLVPMKG